MSWDRDDWKENFGMKFKIVFGRLFLGFLGDVFEMLLGLDL